MKIKSYIFILILIIFFTYSCSSREKLIQVDVLGSSRQSVVKITDQKTANRFNFNIQYSTLFDDSVKLHADSYLKVNNDGFLEVEPVAGEKYFYSDPEINNNYFKGGNLFWKIHQNNFLFEAEKTFNNWSFGVGLNLSISDQIKYSSQNIRIGYFDFNKWFGWRTDLLIHSSKLKYKVKYLTNISDFNNLERVIFNTEKKEGTDLNPEISLSINTLNEEWFLNYFISLNYGNQELYNLLDKEGGGSELQYLNQYLNILFGVYWQSYENQRIIIGLKVDVHNDSGREEIVPGLILQYDFSI